MLEMLDIPQAVDQAGGNSELAKELFSMLLKELPDLQAKLNQASNDGDNQALWDHTHKLHGSTAYCGVPALFMASKELKKVIKSAPTDIPKKLQNVNKAIEDLLADGETILEQDWT